MAAGAARRQGDRYQVSPDEVAAFKKDGYVHLPGVLSEEEVREIEAEYMKFIRRELPVEGRDFCDMSGDYSRPLSEFAIVNIMLPSKYHPGLQGNIYERCTATITEQLCGPDMVIDYDQLLAKPPGRTDGVFGWHQDLAYWPITPDTRTATYWLAIDDSSVENGCLCFVPGSHLEPELRPHVPLHEDRDKSHSLFLTLKKDDVTVPVGIRRGDVTVHNERIIHGSGGNKTKDNWRRAYVLAYRTKETVAEERRQGFTHSHNDKRDVLTSVGDGYEK